MMTFSKEHFKSRPGQTRFFLKKLLDEDNEDDSGFTKEDCPQGKFFSQE
jgi:hypothetical protein